MLLLLLLKTVGPSSRSNKLIIIINHPLYDMMRTLTAKNPLVPENPSLGIAYKRALICIWQIVNWPFKRLCVTKAFTFLYTTSFFWQIMRRSDLYILCFFFFFFFGRYTLLLCDNVVGVSLPRRQNKLKSNFLQKVATIELDHLSLYSCLSA